MEAIIQFMEAYWGVTLVGGVTVGSVVSFTIAMVYYLRRDKKKNLLLDTAIALAKESVEKSTSADVQQAQLLAQNEYLQKVIAVMFKSVSYLTMSSKLTKDDKIALGEDFSVLKGESRVLVEALVAEVLADQSEKGIKEAVKENASEAIDIAVEVATKAVDLIGKYTKEE